MNRLESRLSRLEAQRAPVPVAEATPYVHPLSPPNTLWWTELGELLDTSPYREVLMAALAVDECAC